MGAALPILTVLSAGVQAIGAIQSGNAKSAADKYNAQVAANNATIARNNAEQAGAAGNAKVEQEQLKERAQIGALKANQGASGVDVNSGSSVDVQSSAAELGELNALSVRSDAARQAYGYQTEASGYDAQSNLDTSQASYDKSAGYMGAAGSIIGGASSAADNWGSYKSSQAVGPIKWDDDLYVPDDGQYYPGG